MTRPKALPSPSWTVLLLVLTAAGVGCKEPIQYMPPNVDRDASADGRGGAGGRGGSSAGTGGNNGFAQPTADAEYPVEDAPVVATDSGVDLGPPAATCVPNQPCAENIGPCRQGATACLTPTSPPECKDVGADDKRGGCTGTNVCLGGACVAGCASSVPCTEGIKPCRKGTTTCATATSGPVCVDSGADDTKGGCAGGNLCSNGQCVAPCVADQPCNQGVGPCQRGLTTCASPTSAPGCRKVTDDARGGCPGGQACSNGSCVQTCVANQACSQGVGPCQRGTTACSSPTASPSCNPVADDSKGGCPGGQTCRNGSCAAVTCDGQPIGAGRCSGTTHQTCGGNGQWANDNSAECKRADGGQCATGTDCRSGNCVSGVCCNSACTARCQSCSSADTGGTNGNCAPVRAGADPRNQCAASSEASCGTDGACDGSGGCRLHGTNVTCAAAACSNGSATPARRCNGSGSCAAGAASSCGAFGCQGSVCATRCPDGQEEQGGRCVVKQCTAGVGAAAGCASGEFCDMTTSPRRCARQRRGAESCKSCDGPNCHDGSGKASVGECANGTCIPVFEGGDICCINGVDLCEPPGSPCCSEAGTDCDNDVCASNSCNTSTRKCN